MNKKKENTGTSIKPQDLDTLLTRLIEVQKKNMCKNRCIQNTLVLSYLKSAREWLRRIENGNN